MSEIKQALSYEILWYQIYFKLSFVSMFIEIAKCSFALKNMK